MSLEITATGAMDYLKSFPALDGLVDLVNRDHVDISPTLLRVLTDLYVSKPKHSSEEERQYTELALRLLDKVDVSGRRNVALKLSGYAQAPAEVMRRLARDVIEVADPILRRSRCMTDEPGDFHRGNGSVARCWLLDGEKEGETHRGRTRS